jgi:hypothetical protein
MSRKHYVAIAAAIADVRRFTKDPAALALVANRLADVLALDNDKFDRSRFLCACGVDRG